RNSGNPPKNVAGRTVGKSELQFELTEMVVNGTAYPVRSTDYPAKGKSSGGRSPRRLLGGDGLGGANAATTGNTGTGAAIGAATGTTATLIQKVEKVSVPSETRLEFRLQQPASLPTRITAAGTMKTLKVLTATLVAAICFTLPLDAQTVKTDQVKDYN